MASTFTTSLKIQQIGNGEQSGIWGSTTNTNWNLIEQAVAGVQTITMSNSDYTLTNLNGVSDEARNMVLIVQGTNSGIRKVVAPLNQPKMYIIDNQTTGGYAITVGASTGAYVTIPNGVTAQVYTNGTNFYSAQTGSAGDFTVNGNFSATGSESLTGNLSVGGALSVTGAASFSNTTTALTPVSGDNSTKVATTAFVQNATGALGLGTMATQNANNVNITGGAMNGVSGTNSSMTVGTATNATNATNVVSGGTIASNVTATTQPAGTNNTTIATTAFALANGIPSGAIILWSGSIASIPSGWLLCNGSSGTPDLRDRFVVGAGSTYAVAATGGTADAVVVSHTHTATSAVTDPGHYHNSYTSGAPNGGGAGNCLSYFQGSGGPQPTQPASTGITVGTTVTSAGVSGTNQNLPPYYALAYIMKS
jgi:hypothetical protein